MKKKTVNLNFTAKGKHENAENCSGAPRNAYKQQLTMNKTHGTQ